MQTLKRMAVAPPPQTCDGTITVKTGLPQPTPVRKLQKLKKDPRKQVRDAAIRSYVCHSYNQKQFALPPNTRKEDLDAACKGLK